MGTALKVILALFPLEVHDRGLMTVARALRDAGHEVVLVGNQPPAAIARAALEECADVIGVSTYCGGEVINGRELARLLPPTTAMMIGGMIGPTSQNKLECMGWRVFPAGCHPAEILDWLDRI